MNVILYALKDLKSQKFRTALGIVGIAVSIFLLSSVSFLTDTVSTAYVDYLTTDAGNIDLDIYTRTVSDDQEQVPKWINYTEMINTIKASNAADDIESYFPRFIRTFTANITDSNAYDWFYFIGLDVSYEYEQEFGGFSYFDYDFQTNGIPQGNCAISVSVANKFNIKTGDTFNATRWREDGTPQPGYYMNMTVCAVFEPILKFPSYMEDLVLVDIDDVAYDMGLGKGEPLAKFEGVANHIYLTVKDAELKYDVNDIEQSEADMRAIAEKIQFAISYNYWIDMPKLELLGYAEYISMMASMIFLFIGLISMLISGILISGILSTSVEERIREFGVFRCLGGHKSFNLELVITQGLLLCIIGTAIGVGSSALVISQALRLVDNFIPEGILSSPVRFIAKPTSILTSFGIGIGVSMIVSIAPALKVMRMPVVQAINPYRHDEEVYTLKRGQSVNGKLIMFGVLLATNAGIVFFLIPRLFVSMQISALVTTFILILLIFLIGLTMAGIGLMPLLLRLWIFVITPFGRQVMNIIKVTIFRYQRRNNSTILMFCLSFSFVIFTSSMTNMMLTQVTAMEEINFGSPILLYRPTGYDLDTPTIELQEELMQVEGIERTSAVIANPNQLTDIYAEDGKEFDTQLGDYINLKSSGSVVYGIDENYYDTVYSEYIEYTEGDILTSFDQLFNGSNTCIISAAMGLSLSIGLGDQVRITFARGDETEIQIFEVVGVANKMPGFGKFTQTQTVSGGNGILVAADKYIEYMAIPNPAWVFKIFIDLRDDYDNIDSANDVIDEIYDTLDDDWNFRTRNVLGYVDEIKAGFAVVEIGLQAILSFTVIICMFGLFSSSYSSIIERKREIGILRALGSRKDGIGRLFTLESLIILLSSGTTGAIVGYATAALMVENLTLFTDSPRLLTIPYVALIILFGIAVTVMLIGMKVLLRKIKKQNLIEIFRQTT